MSNKLSSSSLVQQLLGLIRDAKTLQDRETGGLYDAYGELVEALTTAKECASIININVKIRANASPALERTRAALDKTFDKGHTVECLRGLERYLMSSRRQHARGGPQYQAWTDEIVKVRELISKLLHVDA